MTLLPIHPFPARMAPELARRSLKMVSEGGYVLDPMCGSGTVARAAVEAGLRCLGADVDPLSILMARVWTTFLDTGQVIARAKSIVRLAGAIPTHTVLLPPFNRTPWQVVGQR